MMARLLEVAQGCGALLLTATVCWLLGRRLRPWIDRPGLERGFRRVLEIVAGLVLLHLLLSALDLAGIAWRPASLLIGSGLLFAALYGLSLRWPASPGAQPAAQVTPRPWGWGDRLALGALLLFFLWALFGWAVNPDFIYHWGVKGHRFFLEGGIDTTFLLQPWTRYAHSSYPNLLPNLFAATATLGGGFREVPMFGWTALFALFAWPAARQGLRDAGASRLASQATVAALGLTAGMFGIGYLMAGGPDTLIALVPIAAWPAMLAASRANTGGREAADLHVGLLAALSAGAKLEGILLAAALIAIYLALRFQTAMREGTLSVSLTAATAARACLPALAVIALWAWRGLASGLFGAGTVTGASGIHFDRLPTILTAIVEAVGTEQWHGLAWILLLLPLLAVPQLTRPLAALCGAQLAAYLLVYLVARMPGEHAVRYYVLASFPRLLYHLVPATLLAAGVALDLWARAETATARHSDVDATG